MTIPISYVLDRGFERCTLVSLFSLLTNSGTHHEISLFCDNPSTEFMEKTSLIASVFPLSKIRFHPIPGPSTSKTTRGHISPATMGRLFLPEVIEKRTLYIDGDTLIRRDVAPLLDYDLEGKPLGACRGPRIHASWLVYREPKRAFWRKGHLRRISEYQAIPGLDPSQYFNAGVLLLDTDLIRKLSLDEKMKDWRQAESYRRRDQDHLNILFKDRTQFLSPEWNSIWGNARTGRRPFNCEEREQYAESRRDPSIIHFTGPKKPWSEPYRTRKRERYRWQSEWHRYEEHLESLYAGA